MKRIVAMIMIAVMMLTLLSCSKKEDSELKYVFLFIGDGMSFNAVQLTRDAIAQREGKMTPDGIGFAELDSVGVMTNRDMDSFIPDSASSGTAMATGRKTNNGRIAVTSAGLQPDSIATRLKSKTDMKVGIITTANLNHATPGVFYAHSASRYNYYEIGSYLPESGFDLFIGGEFLDPNGGDKSLVTLAEEGGYRVLDTPQEIESMQKGEKTLVIDPWCDSSGMMSFAIDRAEDAYSLADYVRMGIDTLYGDGGFFIMCEGGRIDSALHANDAATAIGEVEAFALAVDEALDFCEEHPEETLVIVTGDHETGGLSLGYSYTGYTTYFDSLYRQKMSYLSYEKEYVDSYKANNAPLETVVSDIEEIFGFVPYENELEAIAAAYEKTLSGRLDIYDKALYGTRTPLTATVTRIAANHAGVDFTTFEHTAAPVGVWACGAGAESFEGSYDNTEIYDKLYGLLLK